MQSAGRTVQRSAWRCRWSIQGGHTPQFPRQPSRSSRTLSLERAVSILATSAAYDLRDSQSTVVLPMFWHYRAVALESDTHGENIFRWPDQVDGRRYRMLVLILDDERLEQAYADESEFNCLPAQARAALNTDELPLLVRLQYMNECHALNTAAAMALSRHASRHGLRFTVSSDKTDRVCCVDSIGWAWGAAPNGVQLAVTQARTERVRFQAHGHQYVTFHLEDGGEWILDLAAAQFGDASRKV
ncbi:hypothetical protein AB1Y20_003678 [Prymnesium parvum]|uniref:Uncharacterized protein n=1 Tax=Prymnesium parvum TaxID=97485 RepID=A0AB34J7N0_PRYPA